MSRVKKQILGKLKEYANKMGRDHLGGDSIPSNKKRGGLRDFDGYDNVDYNRDMPQDESLDITDQAFLKAKRVKEQGVGTATVFLKNQEELDESFPNMKQWWKEDKKEIMTFIYFLQRQLPPSSKDKYDKAWKSILTQLQKRTPAPKAIYQKLTSEGGLPQNWMAGRVSDYHTKLRGKKRKYDDTNFTKMNTGQPDIPDEETDDEIVNETFDTVLHLKLLTKAMKEMPGSEKQKQYIRQLNKIRKPAGMKPLKETAIEEYASRLTNAYILDKDSILKGTPEEKDAIDRDIDETVDKDDLKNAKFRLKKVLKYLDIEYKKTRRGEKYVQINYIPITRPQSQNPEFVNVRYEDETDLQNIGKALKLKLKESVSEVAERDYKDEYKKFQSSTKSKKYRAELNKYNRDKGTYGNGDGKDASHKGGKIVGFESASKNRGRAEKSRLKKK